MSKPTHRFYATLLDAFEGYLHSDRVYDEYWGFSDNPSKTPEEFEAEQYQGLIDRINRVPFDSEAADRGTAFNEVVDCMILGRPSQKMLIERIVSLAPPQPDETNNPYWVEAGNRNPPVTGVKVEYNNRTFAFPIQLCREFADYFAGATPQVWTEAILPTRYGDVLLCGYIDELMPLCVHDIKTTTKYSVGKFRHNWQHLVYPYCLIESGNNITDFEYNVAQLTLSRTDGSIIKTETFTESYKFVPEVDVPRLTEQCEQFIEFLKANRHLITDKRIFCEDVV